MKNYKLFFQAFILLVIIYLLNELAGKFYLHWTVWWYDVMLHFLSGACAAIAFVFFYNLVFNVFRSGKNQTILFSFIFVFIVGTVWEYYELSFGLTSISDGIFFYRDTISDIIIDLCGGFFGTLYALEFFKGIDGRILENGK